MRTEADTPLEERFLWIEGRVSRKSLKIVKAGLPKLRPPDTEIVFVGFSYADLPLPRDFDVIFPRDRAQDGIRCACRVIAATQQMAHPFQEIPHGWKTICMIQFADGIPKMIRDLPTVDSWYQNKKWACICDAATWEHLKQGTI